MTTAQTPKLIRSASYFPVHDVKKAADYYSDTFGFAIDYLAGVPPQFAILSRDGQTIMLRLVSETNRIVPNEAQGGTWDVFFWVNDVHALYEEFRSKGATIAYGVIYQETYDMDEFAVRDADGYVLGFGQTREA